jgi:hypothetical protein
MSVVPETSPASGSPLQGRPDNAGIHAALAGVIDSAGFRASPQLAAFLRYIVEATLRGEQDRIKAYTIGVEALGRGHDFDPQKDPIVRVEASRLRQALQTYYANDGVADAIIIDVPRGRYVPTFRRREAVPVVPPAPPPGSFLRRWIRRPVVLATVAVGLIGMAIGAFVWRSMATDMSPPGTGQLQLAVLHIEPVHALSPAAELLAAATTAELVTTLNQIQFISVTEKPGTESVSGAVGGFTLAGNMDKSADGTIILVLRLEYDGIIAWAREWRLNPDRDPTPAAVASEAAVDVARMFGVMHARVRAQADRLAPGFRCILSAAESLRKFDLVQHIRVRDCLERSSADNPSFTIAFGLLAFVYEREYLHDLPSRLDERPALDRSLVAAQRMLALAPDSAVAHVAMMENMFLRGDIAGALAEGERALALNPVDPTIAGIVGLRFFFGGDSERGVALLEKATAPFGTNLNPIDFGLFCRAYMAGDMITAARYARREEDSTYPYGLVAQIIMAKAAGEHDRARRLQERLISLYPGWSDPRKMLRRFILTPAIVDRLANGLAGNDGS